MDDQRSGSTLAPRFLELVRPAPVIGHALAVEQRRVLGVETWVVDEHHHGLALHIDTGVIVPVLLRRIHAVAHEHQLARIDLHFRLPRARTDDHVGAERQRARRALHVDGHRRRFVGGGFHHRHRLEITVAVARLQTHALKLRLQIFDSLVLARRPRRTALELIRRQHAHVLGEIVRRDRVLECETGLGRRFDRRRSGRFCLRLAGGERGGGGEG